MAPTFKMEKFAPAITTESTSSASTSFTKPMLPGPDGIRILKAMATSDTEVRVLKTSEYKAAARSLAEAFAVDDVAMYFIQTPDRAQKSVAANWKLHLKIMEYIVLAHCLKGLALTVGPNYGCVALWMPPGKNIDTLLTQLRSGLWRLHYQLSPEGRTRFFKEFLPVLHDTKTEVLGARDPHAWYLVYLGTKIESREKGYARKVVEYVTSMADREGRACYLESSNEINPVIYRKLGFVGVRRVGLCRGKGRVELEVMIREPVREGEVD